MAYATTSRNFEIGKVEAQKADGAEACVWIWSQDGMTALALSPDEARSIATDLILEADRARKMNEAAKDSDEPEPEEIISDEQVVF